MSKDEKCTCKACKNTVFRCQICKFVGFLLPSSSWLLKLPPWLLLKILFNFYLASLVIHRFKSPLLLQKCNMWFSGKTNFRRFNASVNLCQSLTVFTSQNRCILKGEIIFRFFQLLSAEEDAYRIKLPSSIRQSGMQLHFTIVKTIKIPTIFARLAHSRSLSHCYFQERDLTPKKWKEKVQNQLRYC